MSPTRVPPLVPPTPQPFAATPAGPASDPAAQATARSAAATLRLALLGLWMAASFGCCYFARDLQALAGGWPLHYWLAAQGAILVFIAIVVVHAVLMRRIERAAALPPASASTARDG